MNRKHRLSHLALRIAPLFVFCLLAQEEDVHVSPPQDITVLSRQLRVDLYWNGSAKKFEVERSKQPQGPFEPVTTTYSDKPFFTDFIGQPGGDYYYRVRAVNAEGKDKKPLFSDWAPVAHASPLPNEPEKLLTEVQEAGVRYFYHYGHPISGLARESFMRNPDLCATGATGMGLFNLIVGVERMFLPRNAAAERVVKILDFLAEKSERFHGAFPHWINGATGKTVPFSHYDDGADLVETAFLIQGVIAAREYFKQDNEVEKRIRERAEKLWRGVEWNWFERHGKTGNSLQWHWSPNHEWTKNLRIAGFNEAHAAYLLALASPTHPIQPQCYAEGWMSPNLNEQRDVLGVPLQISRGLGPSLFFTHYSYLGFDPKKLSFHSKSYFEHFQDLCRVQVKYAASRAPDFTGYGPLWGVTASYGPDGYRAFAPGTHDNGTLAPTAALSSMPYVPDESRNCLLEMYQKHGKELWGPFGFYDAFNLKRKWVSNDVLGIDVGPIAPMIENYRTGLCWKLFMNAPEIKATVESLNTPASKTITAP